MARIVIGIVFVGIVSFVGACLVLAVIGVIDTVAALLGALSA
jgi:hypothetical protein